MTFPAPVTVGPVGSGADFTGSDQTPINAAIASLPATGGSIVVWAGTYNVTSEIIATGSNIDITFETGALVQMLATTPKFLGSISAEEQAGPGPTFWCSIFVLGNATNITVTNLHVKILNTTDGISAVVVAGNVKNCKFYNAQADFATRWARFHTGYYHTSSGFTFDGGIYGLEWFAPKSYHCGNNVTPDGGGTKFFNGSTRDWVEDITEYAPTDTLLYFTSWDVNSQGPLQTKNGNSCRNLERFGGFAQFAPGQTNPMFGIYIEPSWARGAESVRIWGGKYDGVGRVAGGAGLVVGASSNAVSVVGAEFWAWDTGWELIGLASVPETGGNITLSQLKSIRCNTGVRIDTTGGGTGTNINGLHVSDCVVDDQGTNVMTNGLVLGGSPNKEIIDFVLRGCDFTKVASGGKPVSFGSATGPMYPGARWRDNRGVTDLGMINNPLAPFGTTTTSEIRNSGTGPNPSPNTFYKINLRNPTISSTGGGSGLAITIQHPDGTILGTMSASPGAYAAPKASEWYLVQGSNITLDSSPATGSPAAAIYVISPDGTVVLDGVSSCVGAVIPNGSYVTWGAFGGTVSATVYQSGTPVTNPFSDLSALPPTLNPITLLWGSRISFGPFPMGSPPTVTVVENGASSSITNPFYQYRDLSLMGSSATIVANMAYDVRATAMYVSFSLTSGQSVTIADSQNNTLASYSGPTTISAQRLEPGYRITFSAVVSVSVFVAPG